MIKRKAVFLDRDGVVNRKMPDGQYVKNWKEFHFIPGVFKALRLIKQNDFLILLITNQRCISRGIMSESKLIELHEKMLTKLKTHSAILDNIYYCPHDIDQNCDCRKPKPGLISRAIMEYRVQGIEIDISNSYLIGDSETDIIAGKALGLSTIAIGKDISLSDFCSNNLLDATRYILDLSVSN